MQRYRAICFLWCFLTLGRGPLPAQQTDFFPPALPEMENFTTPEKLTAQGVYDITQNDRGMLYFGVDGGVLEFDGVFWNFIPVNGIVRSVAFDGNRVYAGATSNFGFLKADTIGRLKYTPLIDSLPVGEQNIGGAWFIKSTSREVVFNTLYGLYRLKKDSLSVTRSPSLTIQSVVIGDTIFLRHSNQGLKKVGPDSLELVPGGAAIARIGLAAIIPTRRDGPAAADNPWVLVTRRDPLIIYDGLTMRPFPVENEQELIDARPYKGLRLPDGNLVIGTYLQGLYIYDVQGNLLQRIHRENGLVGNSVQSMFLDRDQNLWVGCRNGLSRLDVGRPLRYYDYRNGLDGRGNHLVRFQGALYTANNKGVHRLGPDGQFTTVPYVLNQTWQLLATEAHLLAASTDGIIWVNGPVNEDHRIIKPVNTYRLHRPAASPQRVIYAAPDHLGTLRFDSLRNTWTDEGSFLPMDHLAFQFLEYPANTLWVRADSAVERYTLSFANSGPAAETTRLFGPADGIPGKVAALFVFQDQVYASGTEGLFVFDPDADAFRPSSRLQTPADQDPGWQMLTEVVTDGQRYWGWAAPEGQLLEIVPAPSGGYAWHSFSKELTRSANGYRTYWDAASDPAQPVLWFSTPNGLMRYRIPPQSDTPHPFDTYIRQVRVAQDSLVYGGKEPPLKRLNLRPGTDALRLAFASPRYQNRPTLRYQYRLEGFEKNWSAPTLEKTKDYTNLNPGDYTFHVRALDLDGNPSTPAGFSFVIATPWYLTWWAFMLYGLLFSTLVWGLIKSRVWYLEQQNLALESEVQRRTALIEEQAAQLRESERIKSRFFANISHEFRTPLTVIKGMAEQLRRKNDAPPEQGLELIERNSHLLLRLVNQLLDLTKLESRQMRLHPVQDNIIAYLEYLVESFQSLAESRDIRLRFQ